jgi:hypothetical protein
MPERVTPLFSKHRFELQPETEESLVEIASIRLWRLSKTL